jgi:cell wall-associated NlpC family hydrolase
MRSDLVAEARTWKGTPYVVRGRRKGYEADCIFFQEVFREVCGYGKVYKGYSLMPKNREIEKVLDADLVCVAIADRNPIKFRELLEGRLALFTGSDPNEPQHIGMIANHPKLPEARTLIHAYGRQNNGGVVTENTICTASTFRRNGEVRSGLGGLWKLYDVPGVTDV